MFGAADALEKVENFLRAQNDGQLLGFLGCRDDLIEGPLPFERDLVEKSQGGDGNEDGTWRQLLFVGEVDLIGPDILGSQILRGFVEVACEQRNLLHVGGLRVRRKIPHLHVFGHALPKGCHERLLCEMECAASSNSMLSQTPCFRTGARRIQARKEALPNPASPQLDDELSGLHEYREAV